MNNNRPSATASGSPSQSSSDFSFHKQTKIGAGKTHCSLLVGSLTEKNLFIRWIQYYICVKTEASTPFLLSTATSEATRLFSRLSHETFPTPPPPFPTSQSSQLKQPVILTWMTMTMDGQAPSCAAVPGQGGIIAFHPAGNQYSSDGNLGRTSPFTYRLPEKTQPLSWGIFQHHQKYHNLQFKDTLWRAL